VGSREELAGARLRIYLVLLQSGTPRGVREVARKLGIPPSTVHYHLRRLEEYGLVRREGDGYAVRKLLAPDGYVMVIGKPVHRLALYAAFFAGATLSQILAFTWLGRLSPERVLSVTLSALSAALFALEYAAGAKRWRA